MRNDFNARLRTVSRIALIIGAISANHAAFAQDEQAPIEDEIVVEGFKGSLTNSLNIKREADSIVDAISAEEVGKFPDNNVAEALQRITGVAIDRAGGEGQFITVRGFGPQFNTVLVNGRTMATENAGREFSFDVLASEIIQTAEVYKSPIARLQEGGIGATVNIKTARPLDNPGTSFNISAQGEYNTLTEKVSPRVSALFSTTNAAETLGLFASVVWSDRDSIRDSVSTEGWINGSANVINANGNGITTLTNINVPRSYRIQRIDENRQRLTATLTAQAALTDNLTMTMDVLYSKYDVESLANAFQAYFTDPFLSMTLDGNRTAVTFTRPGSSALAGLDNVTPLAAFGGANDAAGCRQLAGAERQHPDWRQPEYQNLADRSQPCVQAGQRSGSRV